jgi:antitoxin-like ribbon-helix-helix protein
LRTRKISGQQRLIAEAFNMLFAKYGKPTVAT